MKVLIIESDSRTAERLLENIFNFNKDSEVLGIMDSVEKSLVWLNSNPEPDLILLNTDLSDGTSFEIFKIKPLETPLIFVSSHEKYAFQSYRLNCIDYLLTPLNKEAIQSAFYKYNALKSNATTNYAFLNQSINTLIKKHKTRFSIKYGDTIQFKNIEEIAYFFADDKIVYLVTLEGRKYLIDYTLENLERLINPISFFRINRKFFVSINAIQKIKTLINNRLQIFIKPMFEKDVFVSKERSTEFKLWLDI